MINYIKYLKDNPEGYWFKRRLFGWGWIPARWQGWLVVLAFVIILILDSIYLNVRVSPGGEMSGVDLILFLGIVVISILVLIFIGYWKGEKPRWSWGK